jgi:two-component system, sensor histidine kinase
MFRRLRTKLTVLYASLFAGTLLLISVAVFAAVSQNAVRIVRDDLITSSTVFDRVWALRTAQLENGAALLSRDFGFREAVASHDNATIKSSLDNLKQRLGIDLAFIVAPDGRVTTVSDRPVGEANGGILASLEGDESLQGVFLIGDTPYQAVSVPILAPTTIGWVVFASRLDAAQMRALEGLSAIPLNAQILSQDRRGRWSGQARTVGADARERESRFIDSMLKSHAQRPRNLALGAESAIALVKPLRTIGGGRPIVLLLQYPVARAMAPYRPLLGAVFVTGLVGFVLLVAGTWALARSVTRPISALEDAARRLQRGEQTTVSAETNDEIGRLANSFNSMVAEIGQRENDLRAAQAFLDGVIGHLPVAVFVRDSQHRFVLLNRFAENLIGVSNAAAMGKTDYDLLPKDQADFFVEQDRRVFKSGELLLIPEHPLQLGDDELRHIQIKRIAIPGADGAPQYVVSIVEDITERKRAAEALEHARDRAEAASRAKTSFLANMSHEIRTPLNGVLGVAGILARTPLDGKQREMVGIIENSANVLQRVLNDVLDLAKVEAGRLQIVEDAFCLGDALTALTSAAAVQCKAKGLDFSLDIAPAARGVVIGDRVRLEQILGNLLGNAVKFTEAGQIALTVAPVVNEQPVFRFEVHDTGIGFEPEIGQALFEPFRQADGGMARRFGGTGLGLSIARDLARAMGGELTGVGVPGEGAVFTLDLPLSQGAETAPVQPATSAPSASFGPAPETQDVEERLRVLLADDHPTNRAVVQLILDSAGVDLISVENGAEAVEAFEAGEFDIVLMDMQMPVMDGLTAIETIRRHERQARRARTPILVLSANALPEHLAAAHAAGADGHAAKPITAPALLAGMDEAFAAASSADALEPAI